MSRTAKPDVTVAAITDWLAAYHGEHVAGVAPLSGGFWSSAWTYRLGNREQVLRISNSPDGFDIDAAAMRFDAPGLPVPAVLDVGQAFDRWFAVSERHYGRFLESVSSEEVDAAGPTLAALLAALRSAPPAQDDRVFWYDDGPATTWHDRLLDGLEDGTSDPVNGWRTQIAADSRMDSLFRRCEARIRSLLPLCPTRRDLVHGDLLHQNVLISPDAASVTAVFSWKCSMRGDFLYDVAWCTLWGAWHPGIAAADAWGRTLAAPDLDAADLAHAAERHHCYELQIGASHLGWYVWTDDEPELVRLADVLDAILERGPLPD